MTHAKRTSGVGSRKRCGSSRKKTEKRKNGKTERKTVADGHKKSSKYYKTVIDAYKKLEMQGMTRTEKARYLNGYTKEQVKLDDYDLEILKIKKEIEEEKKWLDSNFKKKAWYMKW